MTIDINELRLLVQDCKLAGSPVFVRVADMNELLDRLEADESDALEQARLNGMGASREAALMAKLEAAEKERDALRAAMEKIADWYGAWGPYPETNKSWCAMAIVTAREAVKPLYLAPGAK